MISSSTNPSQILVIDDNEPWLRSLAVLGINVFNCHGVADRGIVEFIDPIANQLEIVIINKHLLHIVGSNRLESQGLKLVETILRNRYPVIKFLIISFNPEPIELKLFFLYEEFLNHINTNYYG